MMANSYLEMLFKYPEQLGWPILMGLLVSSACALVGCFLMLRRMALVGDAISHSVLPGVVIAFMISKSRDSVWIFLGALVAGILTTVMIEVIHARTRVKEDAAIGITFTTLFSIGVILISLYGGRVDLDLDCILYGKLDVAFAATESGAWLPPRIFFMLMVALAVGALLIAFFKELVVCSFDDGLAASLGLNPGLFHFGLMCVLSLTVVAGFEAVGAVLVVAMLILPGATALLLVDRVPPMLGLSLIHALLSTIGGAVVAYHMNWPSAAAMVVVGSALFALAWLASPRDGLMRRWFAKSQSPNLTTPAPASKMELDL
ncbi:MAG: metal ABC transporter permease [Verrucomicrobiota bacterium]